MKEADNSKNTYVLLLELNAFQYSLTDDRLALKDWKRFEEKKFPENDGDAKLGYPQRIIADAISLWPERRKSLLKYINEINNNYCNNSYCDPIY